MIVISIDPGYRNGGVCQIDMEEHFLPQIIRWEPMHVIPATDKAADITKERIAELAAEFVMANPWMYLEADVVLFESQMKINGSACHLVAALQGAIAVLAKLAGNKTLAFAKIKPNEKFKVFAHLMADYKTMEQDDLERGPISASGTRERHYFYRKRWSVELVRRLLELFGDETRYSYWVVFKLLHKSNRDMADALVNAVTRYYPLVALFCQSWTEIDDCGEENKVVGQLTS